MGRGMAPAFTRHVAAQVALARELGDRKVEKRIELLCIEERALEIFCRKYGECQQREGSQEESIRSFLAQGLPRVRAQNHAQAAELGGTQPLLPVDPRFECLVGNVVPQL